MKIHRSLFYLLLVLLPTQLTKYFFPEFAFVSGIRVDYLAPVIYLTDIVAVATLAFWILELAVIPAKAGIQLFYRFRIKSGITTYRQHEITLPLFAACLILFNIYFALSPPVALLKWLRIFEITLVIFYVARTKPNLRFSVYCLLFVGFYSCILVWVQFIGQSSIGGIFWWIGERTFDITTPGIARFTFDNRLFLRPYATFPHPNVLAGFLTCLIPLAFYIKNFTRHTKLLFIPTLILLLATILITFSQTAWIIAAITTTIFILKEKRIKLTKQHILAGIIAMFALFFFSYQFVEKESIERRVSLMKNAYSIALRHPFTGVGLNNFIIANQEQTSINSYQDLQPVHSIYLLWLAETGIVGVVLITLIFIVLKNVIRINKVSFYFMWSFASLLIFGLFDHYPFSIHQTLLLGSILVGFIIASRTMVKSKESAP